MSWQRGSFSPQWRAFSQVIYIQSIKPQTVLSAGYPPCQMKNLLIIGKVKPSEREFRLKCYRKPYLKLLWKISLHCGQVSKLEVDFLSVVFLLVWPWQLGISCSSDTCHLLFRQSTFQKLTLFLYRNLFITYLCFCFNCKCRSVNIYQLFHLTPCYKRAFFIPISKC